MTDPETIVLKAGIAVLASVAVMRLVVHDILALKDDLRRRRRPRPKTSDTGDPYERHAGQEGNCGNEESKRTT